MNAFQPGDKVVCVDAKGAAALEQDAIYTVADSAQGIDVQLVETGPDFFWFEDRFRVLATVAA